MRKFKKVQSSGTTNSAGKIKSAGLINSVNIINSVGTRTKKQSILQAHGTAPIKPTGCCGCCH
jgi:hypothetical protein